jgi:hypothetical protein
MSQNLQFSDFALEFAYLAGKAGFSAAGFVQLPVYFAYP